MAPREFYIDRKGNAYKDPKNAPVTIEWLVHVIEYSAYEQAVKERDQARAGQTEMDSRYWEEFNKNERLKAIINRFKVHGTDGCRKCETGRVTLFIANENCISCDPESYENKSRISVSEM